MIRIHIKDHFKSPFLQRLIWLLFFCIIQNQLLAQNENPQKFVELNELTESVSKRLSEPIKDSLQLYKDLFYALELSKTNKLDEALAKSYSNLASWHDGSITIDSVVYYYNKAASVYKDAERPILEAEIYLKLQDAHMKRGNYAEAMTVDFKAISLFEKINDKEGIAKTYTLICDLLYYQQKYSEGADYCQKAIDIQKNIDVPEDLAKSYRFKADNLLILGKYEEALTNINNAVEILKEAGVTEEEIAPNYNTRGNIYKYLERYDEAIFEYQKCYRIAKESNNKRGVIPALGNIGHVYRLQGKYKESLPFTLEAIDLMKKSGFTQNLAENYMHTAGSYKSIGDFEKALQYQELYTDEKLDNLSNIVEQLESELQIKYETSKKNETIENQEAEIDKQKRIQQLYFGIAILLSILLLGMYFSIKNNRKKRKELEKANNQIKMNQVKLEASNAKLKTSINELKSTQEQLIHAEKMASLGELTAGIAHEIQNPLNFVNNFSELNQELVDEAKEELKKGDLDEASLILNDIGFNSEKIKHHGKRAESIVKGMLQHSRDNAGKKEEVDINQLTDEYLRLAYHGLRAKDKGFNAVLETNFDNNIGKMKLVPQDIGRVILNVITNAFYAVDEKQKQSKAKGIQAYKPTVFVNTKKVNDTILIIIKDNGNGIPEAIKQKIFEPFFTTKPTGKGTGLGLSMSYDIVKAHGGDLNIKTKENKFTEFEIKLPVG